MTNGWEPGGNLLTAWVQVRIAIAACSPDDCVNRPIMRQALSAAYVALDDARLKAIKEDAERRVAYENSSPYFSLALRAARAQAAGVANPAELRDAAERVQSGR